MKCKNGWWVGHFRWLLAALGVLGFSTLSLLAEPLELTAVTEEAFTKDSGIVNASVRLSDGSTLLGGSFHSINGKYAPFLARILPGGEIGYFPIVPNQTVTDIAVDSSGRILITGTFTTINGIARNRLLRVNVAMENEEPFTIDETFSANIGTGPLGGATNVRRIVPAIGGGYFLAGDFTAFNSAPVNRLVKLDDGGTRVIGFSAPALSAGGTYSSVVEDVSGNVYGCGAFTSVQSQTRQRVVRLTSTGALDTGWIPQLTGTDTVEDLFILPSGNILVAGFISSLAASPGTSGLAILDSTTGLRSGLTSYPLGTSTMVRRVREVGGLLAICGSFSQSYTGSATVTRQGLMYLNSDGSPSSIQPGFGWLLTSVQSPEFRDASARASGYVMGVGKFEASGSSALHVREFDSSGTATGAWNAWVQATINTLVAEPTGSRLVGGDFTHANGVRRTGAARINPDGTLDATFAPALGPAASVQTFANHQSKLLIGGRFTLPPGTRKNIARFDPASGALDTTFLMTPGTGAGNAFALLPLADDTILAGGDQITATVNQHLVQLAANGSILQTWSTSNGPNAAVNALAERSDGKILVGGGFGMWAGATKSRIALFGTDLVLDASFPSVAGPNLSVNSLVPLPNGQALLGGSFTTYGGAPNTYLVRIGPTGTKDTTFTPPVLNSAVQCVARDSSGRVYAGGAFGTANGTAVPGVVRLDADGVLDSTALTGETSEVYPQVAGTIRTVCPSGGKLDVGGNFLRIVDETRLGYARFIVPGGTPVITGQPLAVNVTSGGPATFTVIVEAEPEPTYQWQKDGEDIEGATSATLELTNVTAADDAFYSVVVTNFHGSVTSAEAELRVDPWPLIVSQPGDTTVTQGYNYSLDVDVTGRAPLQYQWYSGFSGDTSEPVSGENDDDIQLYASSTGTRRYWVRISNTYGIADSATATVTIVPPPQPPAITQELQNTTVDAGSPVTLSITATGSGSLSYKWYKDNVLLPESTASLHIANAQAGHIGNYRVEVRSSSFPSTTYDNSSASLHVRTAPEFSSHPAAVTVAEGQSFSLTAVVAGPGPLGLQWQKDGNDLPGATASTYSIAAASASDIGSYKLRVQNSFGTTLSNPAAVGVNLPPSISTGPITVKIPVGTSAELSVEATGTAPLAYQWYRGLPGVETSPVGLNDDELATEPLAESTTFWVKVTNAYGAAQSPAQQVIVGVPPQVTIVPPSLSVVSGQAAEFDAEVTGDGPFAYQWYLDEVSLSGKTSATLTINSATPPHAGEYTVRVISDFGSDTSAPSTLQVVVPPLITNQPESQSVPAGGTAEFSVTASGSEPLTYEWYHNEEPIADSNSPTLILSSVTSADAGDYRVTVSNTGGSDQSETVTLTVNSPPAITEQPAAQSYVATGATVELEAAASGTPPLTYQWYQGAVGNISNPAGTGGAFISGALSASTSFWVRVSNAYGDADSAAAVVTVGDPPVVTEHPESQDLEVGDALLLEVLASGTGPFSYQWKFDGNNLPGETSSQLSIAGVGLEDEGFYRVEVSNAFGTVSSNAAVVTVTARVAPTINTFLADRTAATGSSVNVILAATGSASLQYQWFHGEMPIEGATTNTLSISSAQPSDSGEYWCRVTNDVGFDESNRFDLSVIDAPEILNMSGPPVATGSTGTVTANVVGQSPLTFQWYRGELGDESNPVGTNSNSYVTPVLVETTTYWVRVANAAGTDSDSKVLVVLEPVEILSQPEDVVTTPGGAVAFSVTAAGAEPLSYQWFFEGTEIEGEEDPDLVFTSALPKAGSYRVRVSNSVSDAWSDVAELVVNAPPVITTAVAGGTFTTGSMVVLSVGANGSPVLSYQWYLNDEMIEGASATTLVIDPITVEDAGVYRVEIQNAFGSAESSAAVVVEGPPLVLGIVTNSPVAYGATATLEANVAGPGPRTYSWYRGELGDTSHPVGSNSATLQTGALFQSTNFWVSVANPFGSDDGGPAYISVIVPQPVITSPASASASVGSYFSYRILATHSPTSFTALPVPAGLSFDSVSGVLSGIPTAIGAISIDLSASNATHTGEGQLSLNVNGPRPIHTGLDSVSGRIGEALALQLEILHGADLVEIAGEPAWLEYDAETGEFSGTPDEAGVFEFEIVLTNAGGTTVQTITLAIESPVGVPVIESADFAAGRTSQSFQHTFVSVPAAISYQLAGTLPSGIVWNSSTGVLSGVPQESGIHTFEVRGTNAAGMGPVQHFDVEIEAGLGRPVVTTLAEARGYIDELFELELEATNSPDTYESAVLPQGLSIHQDGLTGQWSVRGQPLFTGESVARVRGVNASGVGEWLDILVDIRPGRVSPVISSGSVAEARKTVSFTFQLTATENPTEFSATGLPPGLTLNEGSGLISGTPTASGDYVVSVIASNVDGSGPALNMHFHVGPPPGAPVISTVPVYQGRQASIFFGKIFATESPVRYAALSPLPQGLSLDTATGVLAGTPAAKGRYEVVVEAESEFGFVSIPTTLVFDIQGPLGTPTLTSAKVVDGRLDAALQYTITADRVVGSMSIGTLPPGLTRLGMNVTGTPTLAGEFPVRIQLSNAQGAGREEIVIFQIQPGNSTPRISGIAAEQLDYGATYTRQITAVNGPITAWKFEGLPPGLSYDATTGLIEGRAARVGTFDAKLSASNLNGFGPTQTVRFLVKAASTTPVVYSGRTLTGRKGRELAYQILATNLPSERPLPADCRFYASNVPPGMSLIDPGTGLISGIPKGEFVGTMKVWAENAHGKGPEHSVAVDISQFSSTFRILKPGFVSAQVGSPLAIQLIGNQTIVSSYLLSDPAGLFANVPPPAPGNVINLTPIRPGISYYGLIGNSASAAVGINTLINVLPSASSPAITSPGAIYVAAGDPIEYRLATNTPVGGGAIVVYLSALPSGLSQSAGMIVGTILVPGTYAFALQAENDFGRGSVKVVQIYVAPAEASPIINAVNTTGGEGFAARNTIKRFGFEPRDVDGLTVEGTSGEFLSFEIDAGEEIEEYRAEDLPEGLVLNSVSGLISGVVEVPGSTVALVSARNASGWSAPVEVTFDIAAAAGTPVISGPGEYNASVGVPFTLMLGASPAATSYNITGLDIEFTVDSESGTIEGTFDVPGLYVWKISANNTNGHGAWRDVTIHVSAAPGAPVITDPGIIEARVGEEFELELVATGNPDLWNIDGLPFGLAFNSETGSISGIPLEAGISEFAVSATNASGESAPLTLQFEVETSAEAPEITSAATDVSREGQPFTFQITASNAPDSFGGGPLPAGLHLDQESGVITGTPQEQGIHYFELTATNEHGDGPTQTFTLEVEAPLLTFEDWAAGLPADLRDPEDIPMGDGVPNAIKFALGMDPGEVDRSRLPILRRILDGGQVYLALEFTLSTDVEASVLDLLGGESPGTLEPVDSSVEDLDPPVSGGRRILLRQNDPVTTEALWFLQLRVEP